MTVFIKKLLYTINTLTAIYLIFIILFSVNSMRLNYKNLGASSAIVEKEYNEALGNYKKVEIFILKNKFPQNITYFNSVSGVTYDLPPIKEFEISKFKNVVVNNKVNKKYDDNSISIMECYNDQCLKIFVDRQDILTKISKNKIWEYGKIAAIPIKKVTLFKKSTQLFLDAHKNFLVITLLYFFILHLSQSIYLLIKNVRSTKTQLSLITALDKNKQELIKQSADYNKLLDNVLFLQELVDEYFTHYIHQLIIRNIYIEEVELTEILSQIEIFLGYRLAKRDLRFILDCKNTNTIQTDKEIIFIGLLNLIFKAVHRSKISSDIFIKVSYMYDTVLIEIKDFGYEYEVKPSSKIQICNLPALVLEKLYQKAKIEVLETRENEANIISVKIIGSKTVKVSPLDGTSDNIIKIRITPSL